MFTITKYFQNFKCFPYRLPCNNELLSLTFVICLLWCNPQVITMKHYSRLQTIHLGVNSSTLPVCQCPKRILPILWVQVRPRGDSILCAVGWGAVTTSQRVVLIVIIPWKKKKGNKKQNKKETLNKQAKAKMSSLCSSKTPQENP